MENFKSIEESLDSIIVNKMNKYTVRLKMLVFYNLLYYESHIYAGGNSIRKGCATDGE